MERPIVTSLRSPDFEIHIRPMTDSDLLQAAEIERQSFCDPWSASMLEETLSNPYDTALILEQDNVVAGTCIFRILSEEAELFRIAVAKPYRGLGYGKKLMDVMAETSIRKGAKALFLEVRESNHVARNLYETCGFEITGIRKAYYRDPREDAILMANYEISNIYH